MEAVANNPAFAKKAGVPQSVGKEFAAADKSLQLKGGPRSRPDLQKVNESKTLHGKSQLFKEGGNMATKKMSSKMMAFEKSGKDVEMKGVKEGSPKDRAMDKKQMMMKKGGMADGGMPMKDGKPAFIGDGKGAMKKGGVAKKMASGGSASARADGIAQKGKTKGKMLAKGGKAC